MTDHQHLHTASCTHAHWPETATATQQRLLGLALLLILSFALLEWLVGWWSHSLALIADAGHMAADGVAIALAGLAVWLSRHQPAAKQPWENWAALINGVALAAIAGWIVWEALERLQHADQPIASVPMLITAAIGAIVNGINVGLLHSSSHESANLRAVFLHMVADMVSSLGVILAAIAIALVHWNWMDGVVSLLVASFIFYNAISVIKQTLQEWPAVTPDQVLP